MLKGTDLAKDYLAGNFQVLSQEEYIRLVIACLPGFVPDIVIHRLTGDGPRDLLIAPFWSSAKRTVLNDLHHQMKIQGVWQGMYCPADTRRSLMIEKTSTLYKMIVLYMLERVDFPLSNTQITSFFLDNDYTTYFHVQQTINELLDSRLIQKKKQGNSTCYMMTETGKETLSYLVKTCRIRSAGKLSST